MTAPSDEPEQGPAADHHQSEPIEPSLPASERHNRRIGLVLFAIYALIYSGFVLINAFAASLMEREVVAGLNLAVVYGMLLIGLAFVFAMIYGQFCRNESEASRSGEDS